MSENASPDELDIADDLLDIIPILLRRIRAGIPGDAEQGEWRDISELRATSGQIRLLRILIRRQRCTMQELAEELEVAPPTVTAMIKRMLAQDVVERIRGEEDWRVVWISATERGRRAVTLYDQFRRANLQRRLAHLSQEERTHLRAALPVLRHIVEVDL